MTQVGVASRRIGLQIPHFVGDDKGRGWLRLESLRDGENSGFLLAWAPRTT